RHDGVGLGPLGQPAVVAPGDDEADGRAVVDLVLGLPRDAHAAGGLGLAVEHGDVDLTGAEPLVHLGLGGALHDLHEGYVGRGTPADGLDHLGPGGGVVAVDEDFHLLVGAPTGHRSRSLSVEEVWSPGIVPVRGHAYPGHHA